MSVSLHTQTGLHNLTSQILNTRVHFIDIWYTSLTSVHYNLEHGLATVTVLVHWTCTTQSPLSKSKLEVMKQATLFLILSICHAHWTGPNWFELATANQSRCWCNALTWDGKSHCHSLPLEVVKIRLYEIAHCNLNPCSIHHWSMHRNGLQKKVCCATKIGPRLMKITLNLVGVFSISPSASLCLSQYYWQ